MSHSLDLSTTYLGLDLSGPIVAAACPANANVEMLKRLEAAGVSAAVMPSLFEEQIEFEEWQFGGLIDYGAESFAEAGTYFPPMQSDETGSDRYLRTLEAARKGVSIPIIGSLNGVSTGGWVQMAKQIESAGASAVELNVYSLPTDPTVSGQEVERAYLDLVAAVKEQVQIPLAVKLSPYFSSLPHFSAQLAKAGADGLVLFNRFIQPDFDLKTLQTETRLDLSQPCELRLPLRWIAILFGHVESSLAATSGVHTGSDVLKLMLAGADVTMLASALLRHGPEVVGEMLDDIRSWMHEHGYRSLSQLKGSMSLRNSSNPAAIERSNYMRVLESFQGGIV